MTFILSLTVISKDSLAQSNIQWASSLDYQQNSYNEIGDWSGEQALGRPDAIPQGHLSKKAFRLHDKAVFGTLIVNYNQPQKAKYLVISENFNPGRIIEIFLFDEDGKRHPAYKTEVNKFRPLYRVLIVDIPPTDYKVAKVEININSISHPGWSQVDAVGISDSDLKDIKNEILDLGLINIEEEFGFIESKEKLGREINSSYDENKPIISPDGNTLYFIRNNYPGNMGGKRDLQDIYISELKDGIWTEARNAGRDLNNKDANGISSISPDGNVVYLINQYSSKGMEAGGISYSFKTSTGWSPPDPVVMDNYYNKNDYEDHQVAASGRILISSIERNDSYGNLDLYISFLEDARQWSIPINLGPVINTPKAEYSPFLAPDGRTLYFASNGRKGFGRSDIYFTRRLDESWMNWSEPQNMGSAVNTNTTDAYYSVSAKGDYGYFASRIDSNNGDRDIYRIKLPSGVAPEPVLLVQGKVYDQKTGKPLGANIYFETLSDNFDEGQAHAHPITGEYTMVLARGKLYGFRAAMEGYISVNENVDLTNFKDYKELKRDLYLVPLEAGQTIRLNNLFFSKASSDLLTESFVELERWVETLTNNPSLIIELQGHTDNQGNANANIELSMQRVQTVRKYLIRRGVGSERLKIKGFGGSKPLNDNSTEELRAKNRRVEVHILSI